MTRVYKPLVFLLCLLPLALLIKGLLLDELGANPIEVLTRDTGEWTLRFLLVTLSMTPLRRLTAMTWPIQYRRMLGLYAFFYGCVHLVTYLWLDHFFDWQEILTDIIKRPYITLGMLAFILLVPLAVTSTKAMMRRLGKKWKTLHKMVYLVSVLGVIHFFLLVKADLLEPTIYALILAGLLVFRWKPELFTRKPAKSRA